MHNFWNHVRGNEDNKSHASQGQGAAAGQQALIELGKYTESVSQMNSIRPSESNANAYTLLVSTKEKVRTAMTESEQLTVTEGNEQTANPNSIRPM